MPKQGEGSRSPTRRAAPGRRVGSVSSLRLACLSSLRPFAPRLRFASLSSRLRLASLSSRRRFASLSSRLRLASLSSRRRWAPSIPEIASSPPEHVPRETLSTFRRRGGRRFGALDRVSGERRVPEQPVDEFAVWQGEKQAHHHTQVDEQQDPHRRRGAEKQDKKSSRRSEQQEQQERDIHTAPGIRRGVPLRLEREEPDRSDQKPEPARRAEHHRSAP